ncbi:ADP-ribosylglycohydrolase family protein [Georgenia sp. M64]|uniref:ADP-ribosylglycohydrolase family protein n=1 Tax=Georgenia sp. M64 TaxID=3120520 RepID=UPI0030E37E82
MTSPTDTLIVPGSAPGRAALEDRIHGSLAMAVIGDALGAPTEQRSIDQIRARFGGRVERFHAPPQDSPFAKGRAAGQFTDDSSQMILLAEALVAGGGTITARAVADMLIEWSGKPEYFPHFAGPSTRRAIAALKGGADPELVGAQGVETTEGASNGGSMRVAPAGLVWPGDPAAAVEEAATTCRPSHFTSVGVSAAAAVAGAVSVALCDGVTIIDVVRAAVWSAERGAAIGATRGREVAGPSVARRIELAAEIGASASSLDVATRRIADVIGAGLPAAEAVPAAIGLFVAAGGDPWWTVVAGANVGDDTDTVACMAGSIAGALHGIAGVPRDRYAEVQVANGVDLADLARRLTVVAHLPVG